MILNYEKSTYYYKHAIESHQLSNHCQVSHEASISKIERSYVFHTRATLHCKLSVVHQRLCV